MNRKINPVVAARIKGALLARLPHKVIAKASGVPIRTIRSIAYRERWKDVEVDDWLMPLIELWLKVGIVLHSQPANAGDNIAGRAGPGKEPDRQQEQPRA